MRGGAAPSGRRVVSSLGGGTRRGAQGAAAALGREATEVELARGGPPKCAGGGGGTAGPWMQRCGDVRPGEAGGRLPAVAAVRWCPWCRGRHRRVNGGCGEGASGGDEYWIDRPILLVTGFFYFAPKTGFIRYTF